MTWATSIALWASVMALLLSTGALLVAVHSWRLSRSTSAVKLSARLGDIESTIEELSLALRNVRSRMNMAQTRARRHESMEPTDTAPAVNGEDPAEVRARLNAQLAARGPKV